MKARMGWMGWCAGPVFAAVAAVAAQAGRPNVLFLAVDDLRSELGCYGQAHIHSPNIDRLASAGVLFERAYCQFAHCAPSRESLLSGVRPGSAARTPDLPELFKRHGYHTEGMGKIYHGTFGKGVGKNADNPAAWSDGECWYPPPRFYFSPEGGAEAERVFARQAAKLGVPSSDWTEYPVRGPGTEAPDVADDVPRDGQIASRAVRRLRELGRDRPFFLAIGFMGTHLPFVAPQKYWDLYPDDETRLAGNRFPPRGAPRYALIPTFELNQYTGLGDIQTNDATARRLVRGYRACTSYVDALVGTVLDELDRLGLRENTIVVLWGDHGFKLGEHAAWSKYSNYEIDLRVPVIVSAPGTGVDGARTSALVELVDIYPTLCELAGLPLPEGLEGASMVPLLRDPALPWKAAAFGEIPRNVSGGPVFDYDGKGYTIRTDRYRLVLWVRQDDPRGSDLAGAYEAGGPVAIELYDHGVDPEENTNLADHPEYAGVVRELTRRLLDGWRAALPGKSLEGRMR